MHTCTHELRSVCIIIAKVFAMRGRNNKTLCFTNDENLQEKILIVSRLDPQIP